MYVVDLFVLEPDQGEGCVPSGLVAQTELILLVKAPDKGKPTIPQKITPWAFRKLKNPPRDLQEISKVGLGIKKPGNIPALEFFRGRGARFAF